MSYPSPSQPGNPPRPPSFVARCERAFEQVLWNSRLIVLLAVVASLLVGVGMFFVSTVDVVQLPGRLREYAIDPGHDSSHAKLRTEAVVRVVEVIDGYLLGTIMLIFAFGLYELFISRIDIAEGSELGHRVLLIRSLDDLKDRLAKVVILILVVKFFEHAIQMNFERALDLLYLALGTALLAGALYLGHHKGSKDQPTTGPRPSRRHGGPYREPNG